MLGQTDPETGKPFVDIVLDQAEQKGTGRWTVQNALDLGVPITGIAEATMARALSGSVPQRDAARPKRSTSPVPSTPNGCGTVPRSMLAEPSPCGLAKRTGI